MLIHAGHFSPPEPEVERPLIPGQPTKQDTISTQKLKQDIT